ncbi:MAG: MarR family transcriptional regulator [Actinomycetota bacterium]|nr:MarR family transcriptional regulator [Actinomycetota bacterium]
MAPRGATGRRSLAPGVDLRDPVEAERARRIGFAWRSIRRGAGMQALREYMHGTGPDSIELGEMDTLDVLVQRDDWRMSDLADALKVDPSTATRAVQRLVTRGFVARRASDADGRVVLARVTTQGAAVHRAASKRRAVVLGRILADLEPDERDVLATMLERFAAEIDIVAAQLAK